MGKYNDETNPSPSRTRSKTGMIISLGVILLLAGFIYYRYYFVFGEGVKAGQLNYFVKKGYVFKTHEGRLIQTGIRSQTPGNIASNEFMFSVQDEKVADKLNKSAGSTLELHYKEYLHALPWRGVSEFVVDSVVTSTPVQ
jgi:flagellar basal body-associated protein FliL